MFLVAGSTEVNAVDLNRDGWIDFSRGRIQYPYGIYTTYDAPLHQLLQQPLAAPIPEHFWIFGGCPAARPRCPQLMYLQYPYGIHTTLFAMFLVAGSTEVN